MHRVKIKSSYYRVIFSSLHGPKGYGIYFLSQRLRIRIPSEVFLFGYFYTDLLWKNKIVAFLNGTLISDIKILKESNISHDFIKIFILFSFEEAINLEFY